ncbi:MAG TPA: polysaccharide biosynthesis/export family protein [Terriglobales bacterium]|nr:polysaccharide biosynthesis/export family protein [Terriglobales bacterium]
MRTQELRLPLCLVTFFLLLISSQSWAQSGAGDHQPSTPTQIARAGDADISMRGSSGKPHDDGFIIGTDDVLAVNVWKEPDISRAVPVRSDGKISLPLVGEVQAGGQTPKQLEIAIASKLQSYISEPDVTVIVQEIKSQRFNVLGQVTRPGSYQLTNAMTVLDAIALSGGFRDFAKQKSVYVLRPKPDGTQVRLAFNYKDVIKGRNPEQNIRLEPRDTVVVP